jgi:hypothetical protein
MDKKKIQYIAGWGCVALSYAFSTFYGRPIKDIPAKI